MGITLYINQISKSTLEILKQNPKNLEFLYGIRWMPESELEIFQQESGLSKESFDREWETPALDLHKDFSEISYLLAGHLPDYADRHTAIPELQSRQDLMQLDSFMNFVTIEDSVWDGKPLVNAIFAGTQLSSDGADWYQTHQEVEEIVNRLNRK